MPYPYCIGKPKMLVMGHKFEGKPQGQPLISHEVIVNLIAGTTTRKGLKVHAELDDSSYPSGIKVSNAEFESIRIARNEFHGEWNYRIDPNSG
jgi:hypothetical protein